MIITERRPPSNGGPLISPRLRNWIAAVVAGAWVTNLVLGALPISWWESQEAINGAFMIVIGAVFALSAVRGNGGDKKGDDK